MENILNLKTYNKYLNLINEGLVLLPDNTLTNLIDDVHSACRDSLFAEKEIVKENNDNNRKHLSIMVRY